MSRSRGSRRKSSPRAVGTLIGQVLDDLGLEVASQAFRIGEHWAAVVGAETARHSRPIGLRGPVLEVAVDSSAWSQQLQLRRVEILGALRDRLGEDAPDDLRMRVGYTPDP